MHMIMMIEACMLFVSLSVSFNWAIFKALYVSDKNVVSC